MGTQARVTSIDALDAFRSSLIIFMGKAKRSLSDVQDEVRQVRLWLQHDQRTHWENEIRRRSRAFDQAEQEYMSARLQKNNETALRVRRAAAEKAKRAVEEGQEKLRRVKQWSQNYESASDPILKQLEGMRQLVDMDMPKAIAFLVNLQRTLAAYAESPPPEQLPGAIPASPEVGSEETPEAPQP